MLGVGAAGMIAQARDAPAHLIPCQMQVAQRRGDEADVARADIDAGSGVGARHEVRVNAESGDLQHLPRARHVAVPHLQHDAKFLGEQDAQRALRRGGRCRGIGLRPEGVVEDDVESGMAGECHFAEAAPEAAVAAVVVREDEAVAA